MSQLVKQRKEKNKNALCANMLFCVHLCYCVKDIPLFLVKTCAILLSIEPIGIRFNNCKGGFPMKKFLSVVSLLMALMMLCTSALANEQK